MIRDYNFREFIDIEQLASLKKKSGLSVSVVLPALNEAATIGNIITSMHRKLMNDVQLIDELIVMDGVSEDRTGKIARDAGADVYSISNVGPDVPYRGKGVGLWKSLFVSHGDILVFIDSDIIDFDERFVCGLLGPLLLDSDLYLTKAYYKRPLVIGSNEFDDQGGRVTEILVRPMLSAFIPELAVIKQPLSGEYAVRRKVVENFPFRSGYGVEIGLLLEMFFKFGSACIAQVDMDKRIHRNRNINELGKMSFGILHAFFAELEHHGFDINKKLGTVMFSPVGDDFEKHEIEDVELPSYKSINVNVEEVESWI